MDQYRLLRPAQRDFFGDEASDHWGLLDAVAGEAGDVEPVFDAGETTEDGVVVGRDLVVAPPAGLTVQPRLRQPGETLHAGADGRLEPVPVYALGEAGRLVGIRAAKKDALALAAQVEAARQVDGQRVGMLPGGGCGHVDDAAHRLHRHHPFQPGALRNLTRPCSCRVDEICGLEVALWRLHLPAIADAPGADEGRVGIERSASFLRQSQVDEGHTVRVDDAVCRAVRGASDADGVEGDDVLRLLNGEHVDRSAETPLQADALQVLIPAFGRHEEEVADGTIANILAVQLLKMLVFLNAFPGDTDIHLLGILDTHSGGAAPG